MKGSELYGKLNLNRNMDDTSKSDGRSDSSAFQKRPELGSRKDYTRPVDQEDVDTVTRTNRRGKQRTKDISSERADRIRGRRAMKDLRGEQRDARRDLRRGEQPAPPPPAAETPAPAPAPAPEKTPAPAPKAPTSELSKVGSKSRKQEYDERGWKYDDTIPGYNKDGTPKEQGDLHREHPDNRPEQGGALGYLRGLGEEYGLF